MYKTINTNWMSATGVADFVTTELESWQIFICIIVLFKDLYTFNLKSMKILFPLSPTTYVDHKWQRNMNCFEDVLKADDTRFFSLPDGFR